MSKCVKGFFVAILPKQCFKKPIFSLKKNRPFLGWIKKTGEGDVMFFNKEYETMPLKKMRELQLERLRWSIGHAYKNNLFYHKKFDDAGFHPDQIKHVGADHYFFSVDGRADAEHIQNRNLVVAHILAMHLMMHDRLNPRPEAKTRSLR